MSINTSNNEREVFLFLVVLGGRTKNSHIELHDVRWVVGEKIEDTFDQLCSEWFGDNNGLHIDSYIKIKFIDGYKVNVREKSKIRSSQLKEAHEELKKKRYLWFINMGGYNSESLSELHHFGLIAAKTSKEAKEIAKNKWLRQSEKRHKDDIYQMKGIKGIDNFHSIKSIGKWEIELSPDEKKRSQLFVPDWYGFKKIHKN